jgi:hypothetical protein
MGPCYYAPTPGGKHPPLSAAYRLLSGEPSTTTPYGASVKKESSTGGAEETVDAAVSRTSSSMAANYTEAAIVSPTVEHAR